MLGSSLNAIRSLLKTKFPTITRTYINTVPNKFVRPSFFVQFVTATEEHLCKKIYLSKPTWQIVYFAPMESSGTAPDPLNQFSVSDTLKTALMDAMTITGDGVIYHVIGCEGGPRDNVYITVRLEAEWTREDEVFNLMQEIKHTQAIFSSAEADTPEPMPITGTYFLNGFSALDFSS